MDWNERDWGYQTDEDIQRLALKYAEQTGFFYGKTTTFSEDIKDAFVAGYKRGQNNYLQNKIDWIEERERKLANGQKVLSSRRGKLQALLNRIRQVKADVVEFKSKLKDGFAIRQVGD
jgi:hypothetical protein